MALSPLFRPLSFDELPGWSLDRPARAFEAFRRSAFHVVAKGYRTGALGVAAEAFSDAFEAARAGVAPDPRRFFERCFVPCRVSPEPKADGFVTGFYEPVAEACRIRTGPFRYPLYARPADLVDVDAQNRPAEMEPACRFGRATPSGIVDYFDRAAIERGALEGRGLEIAWLSDPVDLFFIHVQGAARLEMNDGETVRVTYAAKSGHPFTGPGAVLRDFGEIPADAITMQSIRRWLRSNPGRRDEILQRNRSFIFFREAPVDDPALGPVAAAKVPLTPGRSIAVDRELHTFGTPFFIDAPSLKAFDSASFRRLMIAQDTGSAIVGAARGDLFAGSGDAAGEIAGVVRHPADFYALLPRTLVESAALAGHVAR
ncbi:MAG: transglycosylase [Rhizobiaceae bacterium]|nr:MAG: transglycosylase [Rhizobiaceae bacterium]